MSDLCRTKVGEFDIKDAHQLADENLLQHVVLL
jgi:hypothetical protein